MSSYNSTWNVVYVRVTSCKLYSISNMNINFSTVLFRLHHIAAFTQYINILVVVSVYLDRAVICNAVERTHAEAVSRSGAYTDYYFAKNPGC